MEKIRGFARVLARKRVSQQLNKRSSESRTSSTVCASAYAAISSSWEGFSEQSTVPTLMHLDMHFSVQPVSRERSIAS